MLNMRHRVMPLFLTRVLLIVGIFFFAAASSAQNQVVKIKGKNITIKSAFEQIEKQTGVTIDFDQSVINVNNRIGRSVRSTNLRSVLAEILQGTNSEVLFQNKHVIVRAKTTAPVNSSPKSIPQAEKKHTKKITGKITDATTGDPIIGANVVAKGTDNRAVSDIDGNFNINVDSNAPLVITYTGYQTQEVNIAGQSVVSVTMSEDNLTLQDVVVVGYGTQKKASVVGAITNVKPSSLRVSNTKSLSNNLAGMVSGILAVQRSGDPWNNGSDFWIRGISTLGGNRNPLVLIDGVERDLNNIDVEEIESFSVLKDASASAVYGVRGANGVIMINTKRGAVGTPKVNLRFERNFTSPTKVPEYIGSVKYLELINEIKVRDGLAPFISEEDLDKYRNQTDPDLYPDVDWWKELAKDYADNLRFNATINGGTNKLRYAFVLGYFNERGLLKRDSSKDWDSSLKVQRYNVRSNVDVNISNTTLVTINLGGFLQTRNGPPGNITDQEVFEWVSKAIPFEYPTIYSTGQLPRRPFGQNPWAYLTQRGYETWNQYKLESQASIEQDLKFWVPGLKAKVTFAFDKLSANSVSRSKEPDYYNPATSRDEDGNLILTIQNYGQEYLGYSTGSEWGTQRTYLEANLNYSRTFGKVHDVSAMLVANRTNYDNGSSLPFRSQGLAGRFSYIYGSRYIGEFNFGWNGSENFAPKKRYGFFPSVALGWLISEENFMKNLKGTISKLKIRGSWGKAGNSDIGGRRFAYITTIENIRGYSLGPDGGINKTGLAEGDIGVSDLTWETVQKFNLGFELGMWDGALDFIFDVFKEKRSNIFITRGNIPASAGFTKAVWDNFGKVNNQGVDMSLNFNKQLSKDWSLSALANFTYAHNEVIERDEPISIIGTTRARTGHPVSQHFGFIAERLFTADDFNADGTLREGIPVQKYNAQLYPGDIKYVDINNDKEINDLDQTAIGGTDDPTTVYGFGATVRYKIFDFGFFFQGAGGTDRILGGDGWLPGSKLGSSGAILSNIDDRWTEQNPSQNVFWPRVSNGTNANNELPSTWWLKDMSFLRLRNLEVGCTFKNKWTRSVLVDNLRLFFRANNILTFSKFKLWDPELGTSNGVRYPLSKGFSVGISINFL